MTTIDSKSLKKHFETIIKNKKLTFFIDDLERYGDVIFFGGALRDFVSHNSQTPRDLDIVFDATSNKSLEQLVRKYELPIKKNKYDGFKIEFETISMDIWDLNTTWAFKNNIKTSSQKSLIDTVYLNIDGIAYNYSNENLYSTHFDDAIEKKEIDIVLEENPNVELNLLRAMVINKEYQFNFSTNIKKALNASYAEKGHSFIKELTDLQYARYGEIIIKENDVLEYIHCK